MNLDSLNKEQKEAVLYNDGPLLIIAGAGSGKTRVITYKVAYLVENGVSPSNILAITFTNKAANEMKERVNTLLGGENNNIYISTFHKFCGRVLRSYIESIGYERNFTIYDTDDQKKVISNIIKDLNYDDKKFKPRAVASKISYWKNHNIDFEEAYKEAYSDQERIYAICYREYCDRMYKCNAVDFDDMLLLTVRILKENPEARKRLSDRFKYILVDEYQDTNLVQFDIIKYLTNGTDNKLTVVGDDDQSIYKFRGADISNILEFEDNFKGTKVIKLTQNYRSTNNILEVANSVIKNNRGRKKKELWSDNGEGSKVTYTEYENDYKEALGIITNIKKEGNYRETAVLYRTNAQSRKYEEMCVSYSVPYTLVGSVNFYERREIKDILSYLHILVNPSDTNSLFRVINVPKRGLGDTSITKLMDFAKEKGLTVYEALYNLDNSDFKPAVKNKFKSFTDLIDNLKAENEIDEIIDKLLKECYEEFLVDEYGLEEAKERLQNIEELKDKAITFKTEYPTTLDDEAKKDYASNMSGKSILGEFLYEVALVADTDNLNFTDDKITLMSLHASKGLEYENVYLTGLNEMVFPSAQAIFSTDSDEEIEEERRLCYVGITRAKKNLYLSSARQRMQNGKQSNYTVSRFVEEIDDKLIDKHTLAYIPFYDFDSDGYKSDNFSDGDRFWGYKYRRRKWDE